MDFDHLVFFVVLSVGEITNVLVGIASARWFRIMTGEPHHK
ncbi:hypothetical protein [Clostridium gelidum]|nr:hypothetical protein [Clostridium gelidum]